MREWGSSIAGAAFVAAAVHGWPAAGQTADPAAGSSKWGGFIDLEGKAGSERSLGEIDVFIPLAQDDDTLFFSDLRLRGDTDSGNEGNFGLGVRHMLEDGWNLGGYAYFDHRRSPHDNTFNQVTLGAELLGRDWDFRVNAYQPVGDRSRDVDGLTSGGLSGSSIVIRQGTEEAMGGFDGEIGYRLPVFEPESGIDLRVYGGAYHFTSGTEGVDDVTGPRARLELVFDELPFAWEGSRLSLGAEWQHDGPRGSQGFVSARLRIPFSVFTGTSDQARSLSHQERRMTDPIVRDVDVVTQAGAYGTRETATETADGESLTVITSAAMASTADLNAALAAAGAHTVVLSGTFNTTGSVSVPAGQTVIGTGSLAVRTANNRRVEIVLTKEAGIVAENNAVIFAMTLGDNARLSGMTVRNVQAGSGGRYAVSVQNQSGVVIENSTISSYGASGGGVAVDALGSTNVIIRGNVISSRSDTAGTVGVRATGATNITVADNDFSLSTSSLKTVVAGSATTSFNAGSTGNTTNDGACLFGTPPTGSVGFDTITCP